jgi:predicted naringenin-chalcone synthase
MSKSAEIFLQAVATAVPRNGYSQAEALQFMKKLPLYGDKERRFLERVYAGTRISRRYSVISDYYKSPGEYEFFSRNDTLLPEPGPEKRNDVFIARSEELAVEAAGRLFREHPEFDPSTLTHVITVTCTGFSAPGFDYRLVRQLGLPQGIHRYHIGFMGCFAGFPALKLAHTICTADPAARVLIVDVELCTLHVQFKPDPDTMVANALFADGAAAALVSCDDTPGAGDRRFELIRFLSRIIPNSENEMTWKLGEKAFDMKLSAYVPRFIHSEIGEIVRTTLDGLGLDTDQVKVWAIHPGGRAILDRIADALSLGEQDLEESYAVLDEYGNMSSATIFFVLDKVLQTQKTGSVFAAAFGPGLTVESAYFKRV